MAKVIEWTERPYLQYPARAGDVLHQLQKRFPTRGRMNTRSAEAKLCCGCSPSSIITLSLQQLSVRLSNLRAVRCPD